MYEKIYQTVHQLATSIDDGVRTKPAQDPLALLKSAESADHSTDAPPGGIRITFPNGYECSVVWHATAYSNVSRNPESEPTVEFAGICPTRGLWAHDSDDVVAESTLADLESALRLIAGLHADDPLPSLLPRRFGGDA